MDREEALKNLEIAETAFLQAYDWAEVEENKWYPSKGNFRPFYYKKGHAVNAQKQALRYSRKEVI